MTTYKISDYIVTTGSGAKEAYVYAKDLMTEWSVDYKKHSPLLNTKKYIIVDKQHYSSVADALNNVDQTKLAAHSFNEKLAACYVLTDDRYLFVSFTKRK